MDCLGLIKNVERRNNPGMLYLRIQRDMTGSRASAYTVKDKIDPSPFFHQREYSDRIFMRSQKRGGDKSKFCSWNDAMLIWIW